MQFGWKWIFFLFFPSLSSWICVQAMHKIKLAIQLIFFFRLSPSSLICNFFYLHWLFLIGLYFLFHLWLFDFWDLFSSLDILWPTRIRPPEKSLYFSTSFRVHLRALTIQGNVFSNLISFWVRLRALISFECAFEPSIIKGSVFLNPTSF